MLLRGSVWTVDQPEFCCRLRSTTYDVSFVALSRHVRSTLTPRLPMDRFDGAAGGWDAATANMTSTDCGEFDAAEELTVTLASYVPAARDPVDGCMMIAAGAVVPLKDALSQPFG